MLLWYVLLMTIIYTQAFDPVKMRNKGTEAEKYVARGLHLKEVKVSIYGESTEKNVC